MEPGLGAISSLEGTVGKELVPPTSPLGRVGCGAGLLFSLLAGSRHADTRAHFLKEEALPRMEVNPGWRKLGFAPA